MERLRATQEAYARKIKWLEIGMGEGKGAHKILPKTKRGKDIKSCVWRRIVDIGLLYNMGSETTELSIADLYGGVSEQRISQLNRKFILFFHKNCSEKTQKRFPLKTIIFDKPKSQDFREKASLRKGGISVSVKKEIEEKGIVDPEVIARNLNTSSRRVYSCGKVLRSWREDLSLKRKTISYKELKKRIERENDDKKLQRILNEPTDGSLHGFVTAKTGEESIFMLLGNILKKLGFDKRHARFVARILRSKDIHIPARPIKNGWQREGKKHAQKYYVVLTKHEQRIKDAIKALNLGKYKVTRKFKRH
jgi:hypothetical protein